MWVYSRKQNKEIEVPDSGMSGVGGGLGWGNFKPEEIQGKLQQAALMDLQTTGGKNISKISSTYDLFSPKGLDQEAVSAFGNLPPEEIQGKLKQMALTDLLAGGGENVSKITSVYDVFNPEEVDQEAVDAYATMIRKGYFIDPETGSEIPIDQENWQKYVPAAYTTAVVKTLNVPGGVKTKASPFERSKELLRLLLGL